MKFASLGSGSEGNALLISASDAAHSTTIMLDCGFAVRETERRLQRLGLQPDALSGIFVTHEHKDHVGGVFKLARRYGIPVWLSRGTFHAVRSDSSGVDVRFCRDGDRIEVGGLQMAPYTVPHDAREPIQYVATDGCYRLGVLTDAGQATTHLIQRLGGCDALMVECNHDLQMLAGSSYPASLKQRIGGAYGHLSNSTMAEILSALDKSRLRMVIGAHLSQQNNTPELARASLCEAIGDLPARVMIACQEQGFDWVELAHPELAVVEA
ncbi:Phosphoribosyl 1,2-cyclic phosphodiesterase [Noviherbaspirillum humi]|uniref:Phosphoribosyl 1,2-cyclic phosphodiesterase n=1 Tax=Noviherbaspirillum humi TaxID=1688639 RepID=A0A239DAX2_9BURK|nr:MBL fold metallo-hydrolase [Noviherbaspirillum humi]SNS29014.1 Phosphoribosyl 1,2-cyclic phosphodiesterase [Noviherbaspirillum humi]